VNVPQLFADIDRTRARQLGVPITEVFDTMQVYLGSLYVNDFNFLGRTYRVVAQADAPFRARAKDVSQFKTRNATGQMVPLGVGTASGYALVLTPTWSEFRTVWSFHGLTPNRTRPRNELSTISR